MSPNFYSSAMRVTIFWYVLGALVLFLGFPEWAETRYQALTWLPWLPYLETDGLSTAGSVQWTLVLYWTAPVAAMWLACAVVGVAAVEVRYRFAVRDRDLRLKPRGNYWGVSVFHKSLGSLASSTTPQLSGLKVAFDTPGAVVSKTARKVSVDGAVKEALKMVTPAERQLCEELLQVLMSDPEHFAGLGHGVGLLEHTLNVVVEAAPKCTPEFRLPLVAALAHDIGKLITFQPDGDGGWVRKGLHSRESARILATMPGFQELPEAHQRGLILAVKYDHAPSKMPMLRGDRESHMLAMRIISALSNADRTATAAEKGRLLEKLEPEDLLWKDFVDYLRDAPVVQRGKPGAANQVNNPANNPYLFLYEGVWRDEAISRLPDEVAAALDLKRRDVGKLSKYTRILAQRLRVEGLLVEEHQGVVDGESELLKTSPDNPLWDIQSGSGEKAVVMRGILVLRAEELWKKLNYRIGTKSPYPVAILAPNANIDGKVNQAPEARPEIPVDAGSAIKDLDVTSTEGLATLGLDTSDQGAGAKRGRGRGRGAFRAPEPDVRNDTVLGLGSAPAPAKPVAAVAPAPAPTPARAPAKVLAEEPVPVISTEMVWDDPTVEDGDVSAPDAQVDAAAVEGVLEVDSMASALSFFTTGGAEPEPEPEASPPWADTSVPAESPSAPAPEAPAPAPPPKVEAKPPKQPATPPAPKPAATGAPVAKSPGVRRNTGSAPGGVPAAAQAKPAVRAPSDATFGLMPSPAELSRAEKREGLEVADAAAVTKYPGLALGDKFYTEESRSVKDGLRPAGTRFNGDGKDRKLELSEAAPRRRIRRT